MASRKIEVRNITGVLFFYENSQLNSCLRLVKCTEKKCLGFIYRECTDSILSTWKKEMDVYSTQQKCVSQRTFLFSPS